MYNNFLLLFFGALIFLLSACNDERSNQGDLYLSRGEYAKAITSYNEYISLYPEHIKSIYNRGRAYEALGQYEKALEDYQHVLKREPQNVKALLSMANDFYVRQKDYENTVFYADKALEHDTKNAMAYTLKGRALQKLGRVNDALASYNNAISVNAKYADAYISKGSLYIAANQKTKACSNFKTALALGSEQADELLKKYCN